MLCRPEHFCQDQSPRGYPATLTPPTGQLTDATFQAPFEGLSDVRSRLPVISNPGLKALDEKHIIPSCRQEIDSNCVGFADSVCASSVFCSASPPLWDNGPSEFQRRPAQQTQVSCSRDKEASLRVKLPVLKGSFAWM